MKTSQSNMVVIFNIALSAIVNSVVRELCTNVEDNNSHSLDNVVRFVSDQHARMPNSETFNYSALFTIFLSSNLRSSGSGAGSWVFNSSTAF